MKIQKIWFDGDRIYGLTGDGRTLFLSLLYYRRLRTAAASYRKSIASGGLSQYDWKIAE